MSVSTELRRVSIMVDYVFGRGSSKAIPKDKWRLVFSRRSGRARLVFQDDKLFATIKPNGAMALSLYGATILARRSNFRENCVQVSDDAAQFVRGGKSVFCKFVVNAGKNVYPRSEVAVVDRRGSVIGVGTAVLNGAHMKLFKSGVAVKVRAGLGR